MGSDGIGAFSGEGLGGFRRGPRNGSALADLVCVVSSSE